MKFKSERDILVDALSAASRVVTTRTTGATSGILLSLHGNQLTVTGTDLDLTVRTTVDVIGFADGDVVVPARLIVDAVRSLEAGAVTVEGEEETVHVTLGRAQDVYKRQLFTRCATVTCSIATRSFATIVVLWTRSPRPLRAGTTRSHTSSHASFSTYAAKKAGFGFF